MGLLSSVVAVGLLLASGTAIADARRAGDSRCKADASTLETVAEAYFAFHGRYPTMKQAVNGRPRLFKRSVTVAEASTLHKIKVLNGGADFKIVPRRGKCIY